MQLFYNPDIGPETDSFQFPPEESRHIHKVLRKNTGDVLDLTNGKGYFFKAQLLDSNPKKCLGTICSHEQASPLPYHLHLAVAPTKMNDRFEWFLEKATEIGISEITPVICDHSERKVLKLPRLQKVLQSAMKQSLQGYLPQLHAPKKLSDFLTEKRNGQLYIAHCQEGKKIPLQAQLEQNSPITVLIGPEGDFSEAEIQQALDMGYHPASLGETRLRTETAAIMACAATALGLG